MTSLMGAYRVVYPGNVLDNFRVIGLRAQEHGLLDMLEAAATLIHSQLQVAPRQFGDPTYSLKSSQLDVFVRGVRPVIVHFAVHRTENLVIVKSIDWVGPASE